MSAKERRLCRLDDIEEGAALAIAHPVAGIDCSLVAVRKGQQVWVYRNRCPHFSVRLDYHPGQFCTYKGNVLMCAHHSAMFRFEDGQCIDGPCRGAALQPLAVRVCGGDVVLA